MTEPCHKDQVHLSSSSTRLSDKNHGRSTSQMCLKKIVDFISFHSSHRLNIQSGQGNGISIDLNLRLGGPSFDDLEYESRDGLSACSVVGEEKRECDEPKETSNSRASVQEQEAREEESSEITHLQEVETNQAPKQTDDEDKVINGKRKVVGFEEEEEEELQSKYKRHGCLDLLVEAAKLVSGEFDNDDNDDNYNDGDGLREPSPTAVMETQTQCNENETVTVPPKADTNWFDCYGGIEVDMSPLVRSKRGRNQVLPSRYRDSVLEPLRKVTTTPKSSKLSAAKQKSRKRF